LLVFEGHDRETQIDEHVERTEKGGQIDRVTDQRGVADGTFLHLHMRQHVSDVVSPVQVERTANRDPAISPRLRHGAAL
jgi:hypothetical protein